MEQAKQTGRPAEGPTEGNDVRCRCGALVAKERTGWVEVRCRRCKRGLRLRWESERLVVEELAS